MTAFGRERIEELMHALDRALARRGLQETIAVLADGALIRQLTESEADVADGHVEDLDALAAAMREAPQV